jgi:hypothetical protein
MTLPESAAVHGGTGVAPQPPGASPVGVDRPSGRLRSRLWIYVVFFAAWQLFAFPLYRAEWNGVRLAGHLWHTTADNRKAYADGPIYPVLKEAQVLVPPGARVLFVNQDPVPGDYYWKKAKYYLWPRRVEFATAASLSVSLAARFDAIIVFDAEGMPAEALLLLNQVPTLTKAFESHRDRSGPAVYRFESRSGRAYEAIFLRTP